MTPWTGTQEVLVPKTAHHPHSPKKKRSQQHQQEQEKRKIKQQPNKVKTRYQYSMNIVTPDAVTPAQKYKYEQSITSTRTQ